MFLEMITTGVTDIKKLFLEVFEVIYMNFAFLS